LIDFVVKAFKVVLKVVLKAVLKVVLMVEESITEAKDNKLAKKTDGSKTRELASCSLSRRGPHPHM
jgi:hypothetical protein